MCGRFDFHGDAAEIEAVFAMRRIGFDLKQRYNAAPTEMVHVIINQEQESGLGVSLATFGWQRKFLSGGMVINARAETVQDRPLFRAAFAAHRCVVPANGFYEWEKSGKKRLPWYFTSTKHSVFGLAGLYEPATDKRPAGFVILTTKPNDKVAPFHNRMPVMLPPANADAFIMAPPGDAAEMLISYSADDMHAHRVSPAMNRAGFDEAACIAPISVE